MSAEDRIDGGEGLLEAFRALGIEFVFCSPGSEWAPVWEAVSRQERDGASGPRYFDLWHETLAVDMAIGYTQITGRMQAVLLHAGPGLLQGACGIHGAFLGDVPMLVFSSEANSYGERADIDPGSQWYRNLSIVGGPHGLVDHIVKWSNQVPGVEVLYEMVKRAGEISQRTPRGPVYLNVPVEVLLEPWAHSPFPKQVLAPGRRISPDDDIDRLKAMIDAAQCPVILTETGGRTPEGFAALLAFAEAFGIPVIEPQSSVCGNFPREHPLYLGTELGALRDEADLALLVNCRAPWYPPSNKPAKARTVVIDEAPQRPQSVHQVLFADLYLEGEVAHTLRVAAARGAKDQSVVEARKRKHAAAHADLRQRLAKAEAEAAQASEKINAVALTAALRSATPAGTRFVDETITHARTIHQHLPCAEAQHYMYVQGGLGQGIGVALGVKLALPDDLVVLTVGDGSFLYNPIVQGLAAARDFDLPILIIIYNNKKYLSMMANHLRFYPDAVAKTRPRFHGVDLSTQPALESFGEPFGMHCAQVSDPAALDAAVAAAVAAVKSGRTAILNVMLDR